MTIVPSLRVKRCWEYPGIPHCLKTPLDIGLDSPQSPTESSQPIETRESLPPYVQEFVGLECLHRRWSSKGCSCFSPLRSPDIKIYWKYSLVSKNLKSL